MKEIRKRLTYANVMSSLAVFMVLGGGAAIASNHILPKNSVGTPQLKKNAVKTGKVARNAIRVGKLAPEAVKAGKLAKNAVPTNRLRDSAVATGKIADLGVTSGKLANESVLTDKLASDAVTTGKIANDAVTAGKLVPSERSEGFQVAETSGTVGPLPNLGSSPATVATLQLPAGGNYVVTGETQLINTDIGGGGTNHYTQCVLNDDGAQIATQFSGLYSAAGLFPSGGVTLAGVSDGGTLVLACRSDNNANTFAFIRRIIAVRVGSVG